MHLRRFVKADLFKDRIEKPFETNQSFYPTPKDVANHVYMAISRHKYPKLDQDELEHRIEDWKKEDPDSYCYLRKYETAKLNEMENREKQIHQKFQKLPILYM